LRETVGGGDFHGCGLPLGDPPERSFGEALVGGGGRTYWTYGSASTGFARATRLGVARSSSERALLSVPTASACYIPPSINRDPTIPMIMNSTIATRITTTVYDPAFSTGDFIRIGSPTYSR
jgi:hypothetical protein